MTGTAASCLCCPDLHNAYPLIVEAVESHVPRVFYVAYAAQRWLYNIRQELLVWERVSPLLQDLVQRTKVAAI